MKGAPNGRALRASGERKIHDGCLHVFGAAPNGDHLAAGDLTSHVRQRYRAEPWRNSAGAYLTGILI